MGAHRFRQWRPAAHEWEALLGEMRRRADKAGHLRFALPKEYGGKDGSNLGWRSSASISPPRGSACTTTCRTKFDRRQLADWC
jgi:alkylation response protein AidB-like acyl-CoA dehydrogenase